MGVVFRQSKITLYSTVPFGLQKFHRFHGLLILFRTVANFFPEGVGNCGAHQASYKQPRLKALKDWGQGIDEW